LRDEDPFAVKEEEKEAADKNLEELKMSSYVIDMQIPAPVS